MWITSTAPWPFLATFCCGDVEKVHFSFLRFSSGSMTHVLSKRYKGMLLPLFFITKNSKWTSRTSLALSSSRSVREIQFVQTFLFPRCIERIRNIFLARTPLCCNRHAHHGAVFSQLGANMLHVVLACCVWKCTTAKSDFAIVDSILHIEGGT